MLHTRPVQKRIISTIKPEIQDTRDNTCAQADVKICCNNHNSAPRRNIVECYGCTLMQSQGRLQSHETSHSQIVTII